MVHESTHFPLPQLFRTEADKQVEACFNCVAPKVSLYPMKRACIGGANAKWRDLKGESEINCMRDKFASYQQPDFFTKIAKECSASCANFIPAARGIAGIPLVVLSRDILIRENIINFL